MCAIHLITERAGVPAGLQQRDEEKRTPENDVGRRDDHEHFDALHALALHVPDVVADALVVLSLASARLLAAAGHADHGRHHPCHTHRL